MQITALIYSVRKQWLDVPFKVRLIVMRSSLILLSFMAGLVVFYVPERHYASVPEVWLPTIQADNRDENLALPVRARFDQEHGVKFVPSFPYGPEIIEAHGPRTGLKASDCPDLYGIEELHPSKCKVAGKVEGNNVYTITRSMASTNVDAYMMRGKTLVAVNGMTSNKEAVAYLKSFKKIARRDVDDLLATHKAKADEIVRQILAERRANAKAQTQAYRHLPFTPALPATLPAGWVQHSMRIQGANPEHPESVEMLYKKGRDRFVGYTMVPRAGFSFGPTCGPTPTSSNEMVPCGPVPGKDYYAGGTSGADHATWYLYRPVGDAVAILHVSVYGPSLLFSDEDMEAQELIIASLRPSAKDKIKTADFIGPAFDPYPFIKP